MNTICTKLFFITVISSLTVTGSDDAPEGYYAFIESPSAVPPSIRPPPYNYVQENCKFADKTDNNEVSIHNFCGDLSQGIIPKNPMKQNVLGEPYPFELIRNHTLKFLSKALPALVSDHASLPKVTEILTPPVSHEPHNNGLDRMKRDTADSLLKKEDRTTREKKFCEDGGIFCSIYRAITGTTEADKHAVERRDEADLNKFDSPPTPCPSRIDYVTPIYARSYLGSWRYVVQIPYEGYFTQTVEVTKCLQVRCYYLSGGCLSSPRWVSLLVAEIFYPNAEPTNHPQTSEVPMVQDFQAYQQFLQDRAGPPAKPSEDERQKGKVCDGYDEIGCFQVRLYYDWFLVPGSCKCWKKSYFAKYVKKDALDL